MGFALHLGGALSGVGQEAFKARQQAHEDELNQQAREYQALGQVLQQASPEYQQVGFKHMLDYAMAKPGTGGDKQRQAATSGILQLLGGQGPEMQSKTTELSGHPLLQYNASQAPSPASPSQGLIDLGGGGMNAPSADQTSPLVNRVQQPQFNAPLPAQGQVNPMQGSQMNLGQQTNAMVANTPQIISQNGQTAPTSVKTPIPFLEDPIARKLREQQALNPGLIDLYRGKQDATTQSKIAINRARINDQLGKDMTEIPEKLRAGVLNYATRGVVKRVIELGGDPNNQADVDEATKQISAEIKQNFDEHTQKIQNLKDSAAGLKRRLDILGQNANTRSDALAQQKDKTKNLQDWRAQKTAQDQIKRDVDQLKVRHTAAEADLQRIGRDPRLLNPDKYPEVTQQLQAAQDNMRKIEDDIQSAEEGKPGGAIAARAAAGGTNTPVAGGGKIVSAAELQKYANDNGVTVDKAKEAYLHNARLHGLTITFQ